MTRASQRQLGKRPLDFTVDHQQLARLLDRHAASLALFARQWCGGETSADRPAADDAVQEAFLELVRQLRPPENPVAWLYRVVRNKAISAGRAAARRRKHESRAALVGDDWFEDLPENELDANLAARELAALPLELRESIVLRLWSGLSFEQIAEVTETSSSTAHRRYQAGIEALRERLRVEVET